MLKNSPHEQLFTLRNSRHEGAFQFFMLGFEGRASLRWVPWDVIWSKIKKNNKGRDRDKLFIFLNILRLIPREEIETNSSAITKKPLESLLKNTPKTPEKDCWKLSSTDRCVLPSIFLFIPFSYDPMACVRSRGAPCEALAKWHPQICPIFAEI